MFKPKFFSILVVVLMVFSTMGGVSAKLINDDVNVNDASVIVVDNPTVGKIQQAVNDANDNCTILIKGSPTDDGEINCNKILNIKGEDCTFNKIRWKCRSDITFQDITFKNFENKGVIDKSGAIYSDWSVSVVGCSFVNNSAYKGGAIWSGGSVSVVGCSFVNNSAYRGGAIYSDADGVKIIGSKFTYNAACEDGGAVWSGGSVEVNGCSFVNNSADGAPVSQCEGGAIYSDADGVKIIGSNFTDNFAFDYGGAVWSDDGVTIESSRFVSNSVTDNRGGAIYMDDSCDLRVSDSAFYGNHANDKGGAIYCEGNFAHIYLDSFNSFENNTAKEGSVVFTDGYFDSIKNNWWGSANPDWDSGLIVEWKAWPWSNIKHHDDSPLNYNPNL